ncbi:MAG: Rrf2 family transcriptional regulator [Verrucomicrobiales bacterium]
MTGYGKTSQNAVAAVSYLAERHHGGTASSSSLEIARARSLPQPIVAKILTTLSQAGIVKGVPGPHGGYALARSPETIFFEDVVSCFERTAAIPMCPLGPDWCGNNNPCPLHDQLVELGENIERFHKQNHFGMFQTEAAGSGNKGDASSLPL